MAVVIWLPEAFEDLRRLDQFLRVKSPPSAARAAAIIREKAQLLTTSAEIGRPMSDDTGRRELIIPFSSGAYVVRYKVNAGSVIVLRVWHSKEQRI